MRIYKGATPLFNENGELTDVLAPILQALAADAVTAALVDAQVKKLALDKAALVVDAATVRNDFPNPGAEYAAASLTASGGSVTVTRDNAGWKANGSYSWKVAYTSSSTAVYAQTDAFACVEGQPVAAGATFHNDHATDTKTLRVLLRWLNASNALISSEFAAVDVAAGATATITYPAKSAPATTASVVVCFQRYTGAAAPANGDTFRVDNIFVGVGQYSVPDLPLDGDQDDAYWTATPGASTSVAVPPSVALPKYPDPDILVTWGDSLSSVWENADNGVPVALSGRWPTYLAASLGMRHGAGGVSGDGDKGIAARMGALPTLISPVTIAATGNTNLTVTQNAWKTNSDGPGYLTDSAGNRVLGYLDFNATGGGDPDTDPDATQTGTWYFSRAVPGSTVALTGPRVQFEPIGFNGKLSSGVARKPPARAAITTILSRNIYYYMTGYTTDEAINLIVARYRAMVDYTLHTAKSPRVAVLEIPFAYNATSPGTLDESPGTARRTFGDAVNAALKAEFKPYYEPIMSGWLLTTAAFTQLGLTPTTQDNTDMAAGVVPSTFRRPGDTIHFSDYGGQAVAYFLKRSWQRRGWVA